MAVRDKNLVAWQAYVITMAFISVGLMLGMFFLYRAYADTSKRMAEMSTQLADAGTKFQKSESRVHRFKSMLGYPIDEDAEALAGEMANDPELGVVEKDFAEMMKVFSKNEKGDLLKLPKYLMDTLRQRNEEIDRGRKRLDEIQKEQTNILARETAAREDAQKKAAQATQDLEAERSKHAKQVESLNNEKDSITKQFAEFKAAFDKKLAAQAANIATLDAKNKQQLAVIADQLEELQNLREVDFAAPQGEITRLMDGGQLVWLNIGSADGLQEGVPFSVISSDSTKVSKASPKARLTVTSVTGPHSAMAKATELNYKNPILTGDKVYSPAWRPGRSVGFALVGSMDYDNNFQDDTDMIKNLIKASNGRVDAVLDNKMAQPEGKITTGTMFVVLGSDAGGDGANLSADQKAKIQKYAAFIKEAKALGATQISLDNLMGYLKPKNSDRIQSLGNRINASDFPIEQIKTAPAKTSPARAGAGTDTFMPRNPN
jgi:hypothetical protein